MRWIRHDFWYATEWCAISVEWWSVLVCLTIGRLETLGFVGASQVTTLGELLLSLQSHHVFGGWYFLQRRCLFLNTLWCRIYVRTLCRLKAVSDKCCALSIYFWSHKLPHLHYFAPFIGSFEYGPNQFFLEFRILSSDDKICSIPCGDSWSSLWHGGLIQDISRGQWLDTTRDDFDWFYLQHLPWPTSVRSFYFLFFYG